MAYEPQIKKANVHYVLKNINGVELLPSTKLTGKSGQSFYDKNGNFISYNSKNESTIYNIPQTLDQAVGNIKDSNDQKLHYLGTSDASGGCFVKNSDGEQNIWVIYTYVTDGKDGQAGKNGQDGKNGLAGKNGQDGATSEQSATRVTETNQNETDRKSKNNKLPHTATSGCYSGVLSHGVMALGLVSLLSVFKSKRRKD